MATRGTRVERDYSQEEYREPGEGYTGEEPLKGIYPFRLVSVQEHTSKEDTESWHWIFEAQDDAVGKNGDEYAGWRGHIYTNDSTTLWKEQQIMVALGLIKPKGKYKGTLEQIQAKGQKTPVNGYVIRERYIPDDGGEGEWRAKLVSVMMPKDGTAKRTRSDDEEDAYDDLQEAEAEETPAPTRSSRRRSTAAAAPDPEPDEEEEEEDDDDGPDEELYDLDELGEELEALTLVALKKRAKEEWGFTTASVRGMSAEDLVEKILDKVEDMQGAEEEEPEPEPAPPKRAARTGKAAAKTRRRSGSDEEPPF